ncbi:MAG: putative manganese transporter [Collinsella sp.]|nr:putative manganese transporter [Collinsella sp.]
MDLLTHTVEHAFEDTLPLVPFLFVTYLALEALERAAGARVDSVVRRAGSAGPIAGSILGMVPQCGFSAMAATLYAGRVVTLGTLVAVFLSTSDEMLPLLVAERIDLAEIGKILGIKAAVALVTGILVDVVVRALRDDERAHAVLRRMVPGVKSGASVSVDTDMIDQMAEAGTGASHIHRLCEQDHCGCAESHDHGSHDHHDHASASDTCHCGHSHAHEGGVLVSLVRSAASHTIQVSAFIFLVTLVLVALLEAVGEDALSGFLAGNQGLAIVASALVGLVPNCSASVVITQLYLEGVLGFGPLIAGLLVSAGVGYLVLFRTNRRPRENAVIILFLFAVAVVWGLLLGAFGL